MVISFGELIAFISVGLVVLGLVIKVIAANSNQRKQLYARLDTERARMEKVFVVKELCEMQHKYIKETLDELKVFMSDMKAILIEIKQNGKNR